MVEEQIYIRSNLHPFFYNIRLTVLFSTLTVRFKFNLSKGGC